MASDPPGESAPHGFTGRRTERVAVNAEVALRRSGQLNYRVRVFDASPLGCRLEFVERPQLDERVWIKFDGLDPIEGITKDSRGTDYVAVMKSNLSALQKANGCR